MRKTLLALAASLAIAAGYYFIPSKAPRATARDLSYSPISVGYAAASGSAAVSGSAAISGSSIVSGSLAGAGSAAFHAASDFATAMQGALASTAVQSATSTVSGSGTLNVGLAVAGGTLTLSGTVPTNNNQLANGAGYITASGSNAYATTSGSAAISGSAALSGTAANANLQRQKWLAVFFSSAQSLYTATSDDGVDWKLLGNATYAPTSGSGILRDPSIQYLNGTWWLAYTNVSGGASRSFGIAKSTDLINWSYVTDVDFTIASAGTNAYATWNPVLTIDPADNSPHVFVGIGSVLHATYEVHPTNGAWTTWSTPVAVSGAPGYVCQSQWYSNGYYYLEYNNSMAETVYRSTSLMSGYTLWSSNMAGISTDAFGLTVVSGSHWRGYFTTNRVYTGYSGGICYTDSYDGGTTWSTVALGPLDVPYNNVYNPQIRVYSTLAEVSSIDAACKKTEAASQTLASLQTAQCWQFPLAAPVYTSTNGGAAFNDTSVSNLPLVQSGTGIGGAGVATLYTFLNATSGASTSWSDHLAVELNYTMAATYPGAIIRTILGGTAQQYATLANRGIQLDQVYLGPSLQGLIVYTHDGTTLTTSGTITLPAPSAGGAANITVESRSGLVKVWYNQWANNSPSLLYTTYTGPYDAVSANGYSRIVISALQLTGSQNSGAWFTGGKAIVYRNSR